MTMCEEALRHGESNTITQNGHVPGSLCENCESTPFTQVTQENGHATKTPQQNGRLSKIDQQTNSSRVRHDSFHYRFIAKKPIHRSHSVISRTGERKAHRIFLTICVYITFFELGLVGSVMGPTIVHMQYLLDTDIKGMTLTFVCQRIGYVIGVVLSGLLFDRLNQELQFAAACLVEGLAVAIAPLSPHLYVYYAAMSTQALAHGYINTGLQSFLLSLWEGRKYKEPLMQGCPAVWSIGAALCPFIIRPFLVNIPETHELENITFSEDETTELYSAFNATGDSVLYKKIERVRYPYMIVGFNFAALCLLYIIAYMMLGPECDRKVLRTKKRRRKKTGDVRQFRIPLLAMLFLFFAFHAWYEGIFSGLLTAFVIEGLKWPVSSGPLITFVFYAAHALGRLLGIPISVLVSSTKMVFSNIITTTIAFTIMLFVPNSGDILMWVATATAGFAMATTYASTVLWSSQYITITGAAGAVFLVGSSTGGMSGGALIAWLFQSQTFMWVVYMALAACTFHIILFVSMYVFARCYTKKQEAKAKKRENVSESERTHYIHILDMKVNSPITTV